MTRKTFFRWLEKTTDTIEWKVNKEGRIRGKIKGRACCPLTAVNYLRGHQLLSVYNWSDIYSMNDDEKWSIVCAADNCKKYTDFSQKLRETLLRKVGLS